MCEQLAKPGYYAIVTPAFAGMPVEADLDLYSPISQ